MRELSMVLALGIGTYLLRLSAIAVLGPARQLSPRAERALRMVAPAVLAALVTTTLFGDGDEFRALGAWHAAAVVGVVVAIRTRSAAWTMLAGMAAVWVFGAVG